MRRLVIYTVALFLGAGLVGAHWVLEDLFAVGVPSETPLASDPSGMTVSTLPDAGPRKLLMRYCQACHDGGRTTFDFDEKTLDLTEMQRNRATWELAVQKLRDKKMPPRKSTQPTDAERAEILHWLEETVLKAPVNSSPLVARRLQRAEYLNAVRDLFGVSVKVTDDLPADDSAWVPCDNVPALAPAHLDQYRTAAKRLLDHALASEFLGSSPDADEGEEDEANAAPDEELASPSSMFSQIAGKTETESAREILSAVARRAYRGPVDDTELNRLVSIFEGVDEGASFEEGIYVALQEILVSPRFLYRIDSREDELDASGEPTQCSEVELASRLSFFLWSSPPDDDLLDLAQRGTLRQNLEPQVKRMLQDRRSDTLAKNFTNAWLGLDKLDAAKLDDGLRRAMRMESRQFVGAIIREDRPVQDFLTADFTFLNETLAKHYGIAGVQGDQMRRVSLRGTVRGGLLTQASVLTLTTKTSVTSPVIRGKWVMDNLLGESIASPPPEVIAQSERPSQPGSNLFQNPTCAQCHAKMDPIGYSLENFDTIGRWRSNDGTKPIEAKGVLADGEVLLGPEPLKAYLLKHDRALVRVLSEKLLSYARGRKISDRERHALAGIPDAVAAHQFHFSRVVVEVVQSAPFQMGRREDAPIPTTEE